PPASASGASLTIRKFKTDPYSIIDLMNNGTFSSELAAYLWMFVEGLSTKPANILIAGGTGSGKTTTLNVLASFIPERERIISIEDTAELNLPLQHWIRMEARPPGIEGTGELTMDILTKNSLRMRPDRIIVGEIRHKEAFSLFTAMNTGHEGCLGTVHANTAAETIVRVTNPPMDVPAVMMSALNFILVQNRIHDKKKGTIRRVTELAEVFGALEGKVNTCVVFEWDATDDKIKPTQQGINYLKELEKFTGMKKAEIQKEVEERKKFLEELQRKKITSMKIVSDKCREFLNKKRE
ncbi:MAG: ATPase, T2SS/T4P/T4SS family, partial [Candidatus Diapherotrites archaeon]